MADQLSKLLEKISEKYPDDSDVTEALMLVDSDEEEMPEDDMMAMEDDMMAEDEEMPALDLDSLMAEDEDMEAEMPAPKRKKKRNSEPMPY